MNLNLTRPLVVFDLETTGINFVNDRIVEFSILRVEPDGKEKLWTERVNPQIPIPREVTLIHGITDEDVKDKPIFKEFAPEIIKFMENCDLAGYNSIRFDIPFIVEEFLRAGFDFDPRNRRFVDVLSIYHKMEPRTLKAAYRFYCNQELEDAHSAQADTMATYEILKAQVARYSNQEFTDKYGRVTIPVKNDMQALHDFSYHSKFADLAGNIIFNEKNEEVFNFGKHKGKSVAEIFKNEPSYYDWMMKAEFALFTKKVITTIKLRSCNNGSVLIK